MPVLDFPEILKKCNEAYLKLQNEKQTEEDKIRQALINILAMVRGENTQGNRKAFGDD